VHQPATAGAQQAVRLDHPLDAWQVLGQVAAIAPGRTPGAAVRGSLGVLLLLDLGDGRLEILEGQLPFVLAELLGALAVNDMVELDDQVLISAEI
jgi:hypothetical protein